MATETEEKIIRRNRPGTKAKDFYSWTPQNFNDMDTILAVQQYIQHMIRKDHTDVDAILDPPETHDDLAVWKYEHLRQFCMELNLMAVRLQNECDPAICTKMMATEQWIFLCAAHGEPKECSALDYTLHTLHGATCLLNSNKHFDSRVTIRDSSAQKLGSIARRLYRIFSHAYFHHQQLFTEYEGETSLCLRFTKFVTKYGLMSQENLLVPIDGGSSSLEAGLTTTTEEEEEEEKESEESEA